VFKKAFRGFDEQQHQYCVRQVKAQTRLHGWLRFIHSQERAGLFGLIEKFDQHTSRLALKKVTLQVRELRYGKVSLIT
jgi:hypothetical protein